MKLPDKIISGDSYQDVRRKINAICDYLRSVRPVAGAGVRLRQYTSGVIFEADRRGGAAASGSGYDGWFKVEAKTENDTTTIRIYDGGDPESPIAGYAYVNGTGGSAPCAELSPSEGWLCLVYDNVAADGNKVNYQIMPELPDLYFLSAKEAETLEEIAYYPLAFLTKNEDYWMVRQLVRYVIPQLWLPKECEDEEEENGGETEGNE